MLFHLAHRQPKNWGKTNLCTHTADQEEFCFSCNMIHIAIIFHGQTAEGNRQPIFQTGFEMVKSMGTVNSPGVYFSFILMLCVIWATRLSHRRQWILDLLPEKRLLSAMHSKSQAAGHGTTIWVRDQNTPVEGMCNQLPTLYQNFNNKLVVIYQLFISKLPIF